MAANTVPFSPTSSWNTPIGNGATYDDITWPAPTGYNYIAANEAYYVASPTDPVVAVTVPASWGYPGGTINVHIPVGATGTSGSSYPDHSIVIVDGTTAYNFWQFNRTSATTATAQAMGKADIVTDTGWGSSSPFLSAGISAVGSNQLAGLITDADVKAGSINHALALQVDFSLAKPGHTGQAISGDGFAASGLVQEGQHLAIPKSVPMPAGLSPLGQQIFHALQDYGAYVVDVSGGSNNFLVQENAFTQAQMIDLARNDLGRIDPLLEIVHANAGTTTSSGAIPTGSTATGSATTPGGSTTTGTTTGSVTAGGTTTTGATTIGSTAAGSTTTDGSTHTDGSTQTDGSTHTGSTTGTVTAGGTTTTGSTTTGSSSTTGSLPPTALHLTGDKHADTLWSGAADDTHGKNGSDQFHGGAGKDLLVLDGALHDYAVSFSHGAIRFTNAAGDTGTVKSVEQFAFSGDDSTYVVKHHALQPADLADSIQQLMNGIASQGSGSTSTPSAAASDTHLTELQELDLSSGTTSWSVASTHVEPVMHDVAAVLGSHIGSIPSDPFGHHHDSVLG